MRTCGVQPTSSTLLSSESDWKPATKGLQKPWAIKHRVKNMSKSHLEVADLLALLKQR